MPAGRTAPSRSVLFETREKYVWEESAAACRSKMVGGGWGKWMEGGKTMAQFRHGNGPHAPLWGKLALAPMAFSGGHGHTSGGAVDETFDRVKDRPAISKHGIRTAGNSMAAD